MRGLALCFFRKATYAAFLILDFRHSARAGVAAGAKAFFLPKRGLRRPYTRPVRLGRGCGVSVRGRAATPRENGARRSLQEGARLAEITELLLHCARLSGSPLAPRIYGYENHPEYPSGPRALEAVLKAAERLAEGAAAGAASPAPSKPRGPSAGAKPDAGAPDGGKRHARREGAA